MSWKCDVVMDLISLYKDGIASETSKKLVKEHLRECPECRAAYKKYRPAGAVSMNVPVSHAEAEYAEVAKKLRLRRLLLTVGFMSYVGASAGLVTLLYMRLRRE